MVKTSRQTGGARISDVHQYYEQLKEKAASGAFTHPVISIDPVVKFSTHDYLGRDKVKHIAINPQTDVPLLTGATYAVREKL